MVNSSLQDRVAIVTGASSGIGSATARVLAGDGCAVGPDDAGRRQQVEGYVEDVDRRLPDEQQQDEDADGQQHVLPETAEPPAARRWRVRRFGCRR